MTNIFSEIRPLGIKDKEKIKEIKIKMKKDKQQKQIETKNISTKKKRIFKEAYDNVFDLEVDEKKFTQPQFEILTKGEDILKQWIEFETILHEEELSDLSKYQTRKKRQADSGIQMSN